jgi:hypothetical protein
MRLGLTRAMLPTVSPASPEGPLHPPGWPPSIRPERRGDGGNDHGFRPGAPGQRVVLPATASLYLLDDLPAQGYRFLRHGECLTGICFAKQLPRRVTGHFVTIVGLHMDIKPEQPGQFSQPFYSLRIRYWTLAKMVRV